MSATATPTRAIHPFGDGSTRLAMADYRIDCRDYPRRADLEAAIRRQWQERGLVVLSHTGMGRLSELEHWARIIFQDFTAYNGGSAPRSKWSDTVFGIDDTPAHIDMCFHNEACYLPEYPACFVIGALAAPARGGATLVSDNAVTTDAILETALGQELKRHGLRYIRNMTDRNARPAFFYKHWQDTFFTESRDEAEQCVAAQGWDYQWREDGSLRVGYTVDAFEYHEQLDRDFYFAGLVSHAAFFDQWYPFNTLADDDRAFNMLVGNGRPFTDDEIRQIYAAYNRAALAIAWQEADLAILDNTRWSHARPAYTLGPGEERVMGVALGLMRKRRGSRR